MEIFSKNKAILYDMGKMENYENGINCFKDKEFQQENFNPLPFDVISTIIKENQLYTFLF